MITIDLHFTDEDLKRIDESYRRKFSDQVKIPSIFFKQSEEYLIRVALEKHLERKPNDVDFYFTQRIYLEDSNDYLLVHKGTELGKMLTRGKGKDQYFEFLELTKTKTHGKD